MFCTFIQNNSGGSFNFDEAAGITRFVIVEADDRDDANNRAENIGLYWDGCDKGMDCSCCGDRWNLQSTWIDMTAEAPSIYNQQITEYLEGHRSIRWMDAGKEVAVHYKDGRIEWF